MSMTADEIIQEALIPDTHSVFVLGSFEKRVTVYAQQVRACKPAAFWNPPWFLFSPIFHALRRTRAMGPASMLFYSRNPSLP